MELRNQIINGESASVLSDVPDNTFDLTCTSPPYDNLRDYQGYTFDYLSIANELFRTTKEGGVVVWVVGDQVVKGSESGSSFRQALYFMDIGFRLHDTMLYEKVGPAFPDKTRYSQIFEYMFVFSKGKPKTINLIADRKNKWPGSWGKNTVRQKDGTLKTISEDKIKYNEYGVRFNIWRMHNGKGFGTKDAYTIDHPARFPESLANDHIISWSNPRDLVLDPFCGSGTTLKMAKRNERDYFGIDMSEEYCKMSEKRVLSDK